MTFMQTVDKGCLFAFRKRLLQNNEIGAAVYRRTHRVSQAVRLRYSITSPFKGVTVSPESSLLLVPGHYQDPLTYNGDAGSSHIE